ncbi:MAG: hypothetical protein AAB581_04140 [Patescibacteria group bacterium]
MKDDATFEQAEKLPSFFKGTSREQMQTIFKSGLLADIRDGNYTSFSPATRDVIKGLLKSKSLVPEADNSMLLSNLTIAAQARGNFESHPHLPDEWFPIPERISDDYKLFDSEENVLSEGVVFRMQAVGYEPANSHEFLLWDGRGRYGKGYVIALGSIVMIGRRRYVLYLDGEGVLPRLSLTRWNSHNDSNRFFLGVCKRT